MDKIAVVSETFYIDLIKTGATLIWLITALFLQCKMRRLTVLKRRLNFVPLPEPEPLLANNRGPLPRTELLLHPCYIRRPLLHRSLW